MTASPKEKIIKILESLPAAVPYVGQAYGHYLTDKQIDEAGAAIHSLSERQHAELIAELGALTNKFIALEAHINVGKKAHVIATKLTVIIPCGGNGGSLFPMTQVMPKCLVIINDKSLLQHIIDSFFKRNELFEKVIVITGNYHDAIAQNVRQGGYGDFVECRHIESSSVPDSLVKIRSYIETDKFLLHYNDILVPEPNWDHVIDAYLMQLRHHQQIGTLLCSNYYPLSIGVITEGRPGLLGTFVEKPEHLPHDKHANIAVAVFETRAIAAYCRNADSSFFRETISRMQESGEKICLHKIEKWFHVQDWNALYRLQHEKLFRS